MPQCKDITTNDQEVIMKQETNNHQRVIALSSPKPGTGTSTVAALIALSSGVKTLIVDQSQSQDIDALLGLASSHEPVQQVTGLVDLVITDSIGVAFPSDYDLIVIDRGTAQQGQTRSVLIDGAENYLVTRKCYLSLRKANKLVQHDGVIIVDEEGRALTNKDVKSVLQTPIVGVVAYSAPLTRSIDSGLLPSRYSPFVEGLVELAQTPQVAFA